MLNKEGAKICAVVLCLALAACGGESTAPARAVTPTEKFDVTFLFEKDGCRVYRFYDRRNHYFTTCGETITTYSEMCGVKPPCSRELDENNRTGNRAKVSPSSSFMPYEEE